MQLVKRAWKPVFGPGKPSPHDPATAAKYFDIIAKIDAYVDATDHFQRWDLSALPPPSRQNLLHTLLKLRSTNTATGRDGVPYSGWGACPEEFSETLYSAMQHTFDGG
eukprot:2651526-Karenia_brevis.AAC.1